MSETVIQGNTGISPSSPKKKGWIAAGIAVIVVLAAGIAVASRGTPALTVPTSDVYQIKAMPQISTIATTGTVAATSEVNMAFQNVGGTIKTIQVHVGQHVKAGQVLATLDDSTLLAQVQQAQAAVSQAQGNVAQAQAHLAVAQQGATPQDVAVAQAAVTSAQTALVNAQKQYSDAQAAYNNRSLQQQQLVQAQNGVAQAKTAYDTAQQNQASAIAAAQSALSTAQNNLKIDQQNLQTDQKQYGSITLQQVQSEYKTYQNVLSSYNSWQQGGFAGQNPYAATLAADQQVYQSDSTGYYALQGDQQKVQGDQTAIAGAQSQLNQAQTSVSQTKASYDAAVSALQAAQQAYNNRTSQQQALDGAASAVKQQQSAVQQAQAQLQQVQQPATPATIQAAQAAIQTANAGVQAAQAQLQAAQLNENNATLRAPVDGVITQKNNSVGDVVSPGQAVFTLDVPHLQVNLAVSDTQLPYVKVGETVKMTVSALPGKTFSGTIFEVDPTPIPGNGNEYQVKATLQDPSNTLKPGMSGNVSIATGAAAQNGLSVPTMALQQIGGVTGVFVVGSKPSTAANASTAKVDANLPSGTYFQPVVTGYEGTQNTEVVAGLKAGDKILLGASRFVAPSGSGS